MSDDLKSPTMSHTTSDNHSSTKDHHQQGQTNTGSNADDIEEGAAAYHSRGFHPVYIGDVFQDRYQVLNKIGYGVYSTVWLVKDLKHRDEDGPQTKFWALKVLSAVCYGDGHDTFEREILAHFRDNGQDQLGHDYICHMVDDFEHQGPNGIHVCLVFELMGETLGSFGAWFKDDRIPESVMRRFTIQLVLAVNYAHYLGVIHTDIKPDNIFVKFRDSSRIESEYLKEIPIPDQNRDEEHYSVVPSWSLRGVYFSEADGQNIDEFDVVLGDWGVSSWKDKHLTENIQPVALRSPEVLLRASWDESTDWWNLGAVLLEVYRCVRMFSGYVDGEYDLERHLAEIADFFGPFPKKLLERGDKKIVESIFDDNGNVKNAPSEERPGLSTDSWLPDLSQEARDEFASFLTAMMKVEPTERLSDLDLLRHPWLGAID